MTKEEIEKLSLSEMTSSLEEKIKRIVMLELPRRNVMEKKNLNSVTLKVEEPSLQHKM